MTENTISEFDLFTYYLQKNFWTKIPWEDFMKYENNKSVKIISGLKKISKPGLRVYASKNEVPRVLGGLGVAILSTNKGIITDKQAREFGVGGEVLAYVW